MDKSSHSSSDSTTTTASGGSSGSNKDHYLRQLNNISHKISKSQTHTSSFNTNNFKRQPSFDHQIPKQEDTPPQQPQLQPPQQHQPPVYNINKNDFRDVVQRLTGSPSRERFSTPPPIHPPKPQSSRLQRIRPPPLAQISNRPPPPPPSSLLNRAVPPPNPNLIQLAPATFCPSQRPAQPLSPLPPFPAVHAAAESPVSAYMRYLQNSMISGLLPPGPLVSPRWNNLPQSQFPIQQQPPPQQPRNTRPAPSAAPMALPSFPGPPSSPLSFGCVPSPRSPYPLLSPSLLFSPTGQLAFQQLPLSPTVPVPSPKWKGF